MKHNVFIRGKGFSLTEVEKFIESRTNLVTAPVILNEHQLENGKSKLNYSKSEKFSFIADFNFSLYNLIMLKKVLSVKSKKLVLGSIYIFTESKIQLENFYYIFNEISDSINFITYIESDFYMKSKLLTFLSSEYDGVQKKIKASFFENLIINRIEKI